MSTEISSIMLRHLQIGDSSCVFASVSLTKCHLASFDGRVPGLKEQRDKILTDFTLLKEVVCDSGDGKRFVRIQGAN